MRLILVSIICLGFLSFYTQVKTTSIDYETISKDDFDFVKNNKLFLLIACMYLKFCFRNEYTMIYILKEIILFKIYKVENDNPQSKPSFIFEQFLPQVDKLNEESSEKLEYFTTTDKVFHANYGINKFPQILFFRNGNFLTYKGDLSFYEIRWHIVSI